MRRGRGANTPSLFCWRLVNHFVLRWFILIQCEGEIAFQSGMDIMPWLS